MTIIPPPSPHKDAIVYPDSDGKPMAENTKQARWIMRLFGNLEAMFSAVADVFVAADNLWYPVEGEPAIRLAPDVYIVFGRLKGDRGSYKQWEENNIPLTVVFEVLSPGNTRQEMDNKLDFYQDHGVEEYYIYDPDSNHLSIYVRRGEVFRRVRPPHNFVSPRLGIRFELSGPEMVVFAPDGKPFKTVTELKAEVEQAQHDAAQTRQRARRLAELGRKARLGQASTEEVAELERLEEQAAATNGPG